MSLSHFKSVRLTRIIKMRAVWLIWCIFDFDIKRKQESFIAILSSIGSKIFLKLWVDITSQSTPIRWFNKAKKVFFAITYIIKYRRLETMDRAFNNTISKWKTVLPNEAHSYTNYSSLSFIIPIGEESFSNLDIFNLRFLILLLAALRNVKIAQSLAEHKFLFSTKIFEILLIC